jgi:UPF0716 protein FxsA
VPLFLLLFVGIPLVELYLLIEVGSEIGAIPTIALSIFTAILGSLLVRLQGFSVLLRVRTLMARGETPALEVLNGALLLIAGLMLLLPGFLTDSLGFLLLIPPLRKALILRFVRLVPDGSAPTDGPAPRVIEGEFRRERDR